MTVNWLGVVASSALSSQSADPLNLPIPAGATAASPLTSSHTSGKEHDSFQDLNENVVDTAAIGMCVALHSFDGTLSNLFSLLSLEV